MSCKAIQEKIFEAESLDALPAEVTTHILGCRECRACRDDAAVMLRSLREDSELPALPDGFELSLRRELKQVAEQKMAPPATRPRRSRGRIAALVALAASLLVALGVWTLLDRGPTDTSSTSHHRLHLSVNAHEHHRAARFEISLPAGVTVAPELAGALAARQGTLVWRSDLRPGANEIDLPLVRRGEAPTTIRARLVVDGHSVDTEVALAERRQTARRATARLTLALALQSTPEVAR